MISEIKFSTSYVSFWKNLLPFSDLYVRRANLNLVENKFDPMEDVFAKQRDVINEIAFIVFSKFRDQLTINDINYFKIISSEDFSIIFKQAVKKISLLRRGEVDIQEDSITNHIKADISHIVNRLFSIFMGLDIIVFPSFPGCGILDNCEGDIIENGTLYEIKAGQRNFRSSDFKQVLIYLSLAKISGSIDINKVALFNPRMGIHYEEYTNIFCRDISGKTETELYGDIEYFLTNGETSR